MITINKMEDMQPYLNVDINTYVFNDHVRFNCDIAVFSNINALNIDAQDIDALNIKACYINALNIDAQDIDALNIMAEDIRAADINAYNITAHAISYYAVCFAYENITCKSIKGRRPNCRHFVLDGEIKLKDLSEETEAPDVPREPEKASFEEGKYYVFSAKKYDDTVRLSALKHSADNWTWGLDGLIVDVKDEGTGYINNFLIVPEWCEELKREGN